MLKHAMIIIMGTLDSALSFCKNLMIRVQPPLHVLIDTVSCKSLVCISLL